jgi:hypothetical protein
MRLCASDNKWIHPAISNDTQLYRLHRHCSMTAICRLHAYRTCQRSTFALRLSSSSVVILRHWRVIGAYFQRICRFYYYIIYVYAFRIHYITLSVTLLAFIPRGHPRAYPPWRTMAPALVLLEHTVCKRSSRAVRP